MAHASDPVFVVLNGVRLKGFAEPGALAGVTGLEGTELDTILAELADQGLASHREGRVSGWTLTTAGQVEHRRRAAVELAEAGCGSEVEARYREFVGLNPRLLATATAWQMKDDGGRAVVAARDASEQAPGVRLAVRRSVHTVGSIAAGTSEARREPVAMMTE